MHKVGNYGGYIDPDKVVIGQHPPMGLAVAELALGDDGKWRAGLNLRDSSAGSVVGPCIRAQTFDTREQALDHAAGRARRWFSKRLAEEHVWMQNRVHAEAKAILEQIDAAYPPVGTQMSLF